MTPHQTIAVALRLVAVWLGIGVLRSLPSFYITGSTDAPGRAYALLLTALTAVLAVVVWCFPFSIAQKLLQREAADVPAAASPDTWFAMGCALIGLWILSTAIPKLIYDFLVLNYSSGTEDTSQYWRWVIYNLLEVGVAMWLVFGARGFRKLFWWAQNVGIRRTL
jgi:hypothetical protein